MTHPGPRLSLAVPLEALRVERMANGWNSLLLSERVSYEEFPLYVDAVASLLDARPGQAIDGPDIRMRSLRVGLKWYWIVFDDFPCGVTIEPRSRYAARHVERLLEKLVGATRPR